MSCSTRPETLRTGDLLFVGSPSAEDDGIAAGAIAASVGRGEMSFIHDPDIQYEYTIRFWSHYEKEETYEFLDALWDDGWELVCVAVYYQEDDEYYFRRKSD